MKPVEQIASARQKRLQKAAKHAKANKTISLQERIADAKRRSAEWQRQLHEKNGPGYDRFVAAAKSRRIR